MSCFNSLLVTEGGERSDRVAYNFGIDFGSVHQVPPVLQGDYWKPAGERKGHYTLDEGVIDCLADVK